MKFLNNLGLILLHASILFLVNATNAHQPFVQVPEYDSREVDLSATGMSSKSFVIHSLEFDTQTPDDPGVYDSREVISCSGEDNPSSTSLLKYVLPTDGVGESTGLLVILGGIGTPDCPNTDLSGDGYFFTYEHALGSYPERESWPDEKDLIVCTIYYRNMEYRMPYDYGKNQVADVLNGTRALLELYPQLDRSRLYLYGGSGGGHLALQTAQFAPHWWAEVWSVSGLTKITIPEDVSDYGYSYEGDGDANGSGWYVNMGASFIDSTPRKIAERVLRDPQRAALIHAPNNNNSPEKIRVIHGEADTLVVAQHMRDLRDNVLSNHRADLQLSDTIVMNNPVTVWEIGKWKFSEVPNGNHYLHGGPEGWSLRDTALESMDPGCFTSRRNSTPDLTVGDMLPPVTASDSSGRWTFEIVENNELISVHTRHLMIDEIVVWIEVDGPGSISVENQSSDNIYTSGQVITMEAHPDAESSFDGWYRNGVLVSNELLHTDQLMFDSTVVARFRLNTSTIPDWDSY